MNFAAFVDCRKTGCTAAGNMHTVVSPTGKHRSADGAALEGESSGTVDFYIGGISGNIQRKISTALHERITLVAIGQSIAIDGD